MPDGTDDHLLVSISGHQVYEAEATWLEHVSYSFHVLTKGRKTIETLNRSTKRVHGAEQQPQFVTLNRRGISLSTQTQRQVRDHPIAIRP
jgi:hypothetical protein